MMPSLPYPLYTLKAPFLIQFETLRVCSQFFILYVSLKSRKEPKQVRLMRTDMRLLREKCLIGLTLFIKLMFSFLFYFVQ